jgi:hypothetical protein
MRVWRRSIAGLRTDGPLDDVLAIGDLVISRVRHQRAARAGRRYQRMWFAATVIGLFSRNVVSLSRNVVPSHPIFSANLVLKPPM